MNERLPYEEELARQLNDVPLPDENSAWEDMKRRLEEEDDDDGVVVPPLLQGCLRYGLLPVVLIVAIFFIIRPDKWVLNKKDDIVTSEKQDGRKEREVVGIKEINDSQKLKNATLKEDSDSITHVVKKSLYHDSLVLQKRKDSIQEKYGRTSVKKDRSRYERFATSHVARNKEGLRKNKSAESIVPENSIWKDGQRADSSTNNENDISTTTGKDSASETGIKKITDSIVSKKKFQEQRNDTTVKEDATSIKKIDFAAGIALHQLLPVNGQKFVPYNSLGRKGTFADYIPSVYFRMYKDGQWFIQSELRYGAPQYNKEILYHQEKIVDTFNRTTLSTSSRLKKTYYHELPMSFNYFILPKLSFGLGITWNRFTNAVIEQEVKRTNNVTMVDSFQTTKVLNIKKADSNFVMSYFQALFETQFEWKRFAGGASYSFGLQPYLKFQLSGGEKRKEKNSALQLFIRYNLWESRKR